VYDLELRASERESRSETEGIVDSWELHWCARERSCIRDTKLGMFSDSARWLLDDAART
jgi:hypothetical protein